MEKNISILHSVDWNFPGVKTDVLTHGFHPYPAKFIPQIPRNIIKLLSKEGDVVLDPFCGCGTTLVEAKVLGRPGIGVDVNPLACLVSKVKTTPIPDQKLESAAKKLVSNINQELNKARAQTGIEDFLFDNFSPKKETNSSTYPKPKIHNIDYWFLPYVVEELAIIKAKIQEIEDEELKDFFLVCFSSIIVRVSNQDSDTRYVRRVKNIKPNDTTRIFQRALLKMIKGMKNFNKRCKDVSVHIKCADVRKLDFLEDESVDLIVTSPPYLNAWDYHLYHRFRMLWLDMDPNELRKQEIGAHLEHSYDVKSVDRYISDMKLAIKEMYRVLKRGGYSVIVIGNSIVKGKKVDSDAILTKVSEKIGFKLTTSIKRNIDASSKSFNPQLGNIKSESILVLSKK